MEKIHLIAEFHKMVLDFFFLERRNPGFIARPRGYKTFCMLNSIEHEFFFLFINVKMPTIVGILTFMSRKNSILDLSESEKS